MDDNINEIIASADISDWKKISVEFGDAFFDISVPPKCNVLHMKSMPCLAHSAAEISNALNNPIESPTLPEIIQSKDKPAEN